jgi:hypothetical protein
MFRTICLSLALGFAAYADEGGIANQASSQDVDFTGWWDEAQLWAYTDPSEIELVRPADMPLIPIKPQRQCTFGFPARGGAVLDALHPDADCDERSLGRHGGRYELIVQKINYLHLKTFPECGNKPGDTTGYRACVRDLETGQPVFGFVFPTGSLPYQCKPNPAPLPPGTVFGCQLCQKVVSCHAAQ